jgi:hypothetical protein
MKFRVVMMIGTSLSVRWCRKRDGRCSLLSTKRNASAVTAQAVSQARDEISRTQRNVAVGRPNHGATGGGYA